MDDIGGPRYFDIYSRAQKVTLLFKSNRVKRDTAFSTLSLLPQYLFHTINDPINIRFQYSPHKRTIIAIAFNAGLSRTAIAAKEGVPRSSWEVDFRDCQTVQFPTKRHLLSTTWAATYA